MSLSRRHFLQISAAAGLGFQGLNNLYAQTSNQTPNIDSIPYGFGELVSDPNGILDLPKGFQYQVIARKGEKMADGFLVPAACDGMAAFPGRSNKTILICNHEVSDLSGKDGPFDKDNPLFQNISSDLLYDAGKGEAPCLGGTTTIMYDTQTQTVYKQFLSLVGTIRNCAGGPTPWNSWISCEENVQRAEGTYERDHGYNFEVPATEMAQPVKAVALTEMGRFNHEAVAVDEESGIVYQTEDRDDGLIYRYIPYTPGQLQNGGKLQAMVIRDQASLDTRNWETDTVEPGTELAVKWIDIENVESPEDDLRHQGFEKGAARFARGEGMWAGNNGIYFACTNGGRAQKGQIWKYIPSPYEGTAEEETQPGTVTLFVEPNDSGMIDNADNLTVSPWGDLIVCEDGSGQQFLVGVTPQGEIYKFGRNATENQSEFAGVTFSPDASTMFVNIMGEGLTLAIIGPWRRA